MMKIFALSLALFSTAMADTVTFSSLPGATLGFVVPVKASATITTSDGNIAIILRNTQAGAFDPAQSLSGFFFVLDVAVDVPLGTVTTPTGICDVAITPWTLTSSPSVRTMHLASGQMITGPGASTPGSIDQVATFSFDVAGVTASTNIPRATFSFGPDGVNVQGLNLVPGAPEPSTLTMLGIGLALIVGGRGRIRTALIRLRYLV